MAIIFLVLTAFLAFGIIRRTRPKDLAEIEPELSVEELLVSSAEQKPEVKEEIAEIDLLANHELRKKVDKFIDEKPEAAAQILRNWLSEDWK